MASESSYISQESLNCEDSLDSERGVLISLLYNCEVFVVTVITSSWLSICSSVDQSEKYITMLRIDVSQFKV